MVGYHLAGSEAVTHISARDLELYLLGQLKEDVTTLVAHHISGCEACGKLLEETKTLVARMRDLSGRLGHRAGAEERRKYPRIPADNPARLRVLQPVVLEPENIRIVDTSRWGMKLATRHPIEAGALVQIRSDSLVILAEVRYCHRQGDVYHAGVAIQDTF
jgi:hypothetical protein